MLDDACSAFFCIGSTLKAAGFDVVLAFPRGSNRRRFGTLHFINLGAAAVGRKIEWSAAHVRLLEARVLAQPSYDLSALWFGKMHPAWGEQWFRVAAGADQG